METVKYNVRFIVKGKFTWLIAAFVALTMLLAPAMVFANHSSERFEDKVSVSLGKSDVLNESDIIYMILTDRFFDSDSSNNGQPGYEYRPGELKYTQGGDWNGITQKLDYIKSLGVTAIWISPPSQNEC